jgi:hypothetical protein
MGPRAIDLIGAALLVAPVACPAQQQLLLDLLLLLLLLLGLLLPFHRQGIRRGARPHNVSLWFHSGFKRKTSEMVC